MLPSPETEFEGHFNTRYEPMFYNDLKIAPPALII
jgi:hypothetical protein